MDINVVILSFKIFKEEIMRGKPGYEHLNEPLHILVEAELPVEIVDARLMQAREILGDLLKPVVSKISFCCDNYNYVFILIGIMNFFFF